jgi:acyl-coenzyme A synthetase/AMP-(fatty) acid ligase
MKPRKDECDTLLGCLRGAADLSGLYFWDTDRAAPLRELLQGSYLGGRLEELRGRSVLIATRDQLATALALIELDGVARRFVICPFDVRLEQVPHILEAAQIDAILSDRAIGDFGPRPPRLVVVPSLRPVPTGHERGSPHATEWVLLTSGTTGTPKLLAHSLRGLTGAFRGRPAPEGAPAAPAVWATFYDIRRYGGLQIFLRAVLGRACLVLSHADEAIGEHLRRLSQHGVTHISGTPTHWRRALMSPAAKLFAPRYVRLSGEIADQAILDSLRAFWPHAHIGHAYASTEAGVGFDVVDGREGFPASLLGPGKGDVEMKIEDGSLRIRSLRIATQYLGANATELVDGEGFVDTGDMVERSQDRCYFIGRRGGIINVGGSKVHPEEVEAVINRHPKVRMSLVKAQKSPITSAIVVAEVVLAEAAGAASEAEAAQTEQEILMLCRKHLDPYKVPVFIRFVPALNVTQSGKLARPNG